MSSAAGSSADDARRATILTGSYRVITANAAIINPDTTVRTGTLGGMSYNLAFWAGGDDLDPDNVYTRLNDEQPVNSVDVVDRDRVLRAFAEDLPGWTWDGQFLRPPGTDPEGTPAYDVSIGEQLVEFIGYRFQGEHANEIIGAMHSLGYRLYDPQTSGRFS